MREGTTGEPGHCHPSGALPLDPEAVALRRVGRPRATKGWVAWWMPSLADIVFAGLLGFLLTARSRQLLNADSDLLRHLVVGQKILADRAVPLADYLSYTRAGEQFVPHQWLSEAILALVYQQLGLPGVVVLTGVVVALPFLLLTRWMVRDGANPFMVLFLVPIGALASSPFWIARPYLISVLLALLWTRALSRYRDSMDVRFLIPLPVMMSLWVNLHGGFVWGFAILAVFFLASLLSPMRSRPLALAATGLASLIALGAHPVGYAILPYLLGYSQFPLMLDRTIETQSPSFHEPGPQLFLLLILLMIAAMGRRRRRIEPSDLGMLLAWTALALVFMRNIPIFVVTCLPIVAALATDAFGRGESQVGGPPSGCTPGRDTASMIADGRGPGVAERLAATDRQLGRPLLPILAVLLALLWSSGLLGAGRIDATLDPKVFPVEALRHAEEAGVGGNLFNYFTWGNYVTFTTYPRYPVFIDAQADFYGEAVTRDYLTVADLKPGWEDVLDRYRVGWVLFPHQSPVSMILARTPGWRLAYEDETADILVRAPEAR